MLMIAFTRILGGLGKISEFLSSLELMIPLYHRPWQGWCLKTKQITGQDRECYEENLLRRGGGDEASGGEGCSQIESLAVSEGWGGVRGERPGICEGHQTPEDWPAEARAGRSLVWPLTWRRWPGPAD